MKDVLPIRNYFVQIENRNERRPRISLWEVACFHYQLRQLFELRFPKAEEEQS